MVAPRAARLSMRAGQGLLVGRVHPGHGLVHDEDVGLPGKGTGDEDALLLAAGQVVDGVVGAVEQSYRGQRLGDRVPVVRGEGAESAAPVDPPGSDDFAHGRRDTAADGEALRHVADLRPVTEAAERGPADPHLSTGERHHAEQGADQGGLA